jgi:hypothetical protein
MYIFILLKSISINLQDNNDNIRSSMNGLTIVINLILEFI